MATRRNAREWAVQLLFQLEANPEDPDKVFPGFWAERKPSARNRQFAEDLVRGTVANLDGIDGRIRKYARNWDIRRMGAVDRNVMRLAVYEMLHRLDIPPVVSINEAVEIAKTYGEDKSGQFVNGILDRVRKDLDRPARVPQKKQA